MDDEDYEPIRPKPSELPPLPRLWKDPPEAESAVEAAPLAKKKRATVEPSSLSPAPAPKKKKKVVEEIDDGTGATKLAETPALDTYEARQRARWIIGGVLAAIGVVGLVIVLKAFKGSGSAEVVEPEPAADTRVAAESRARLENEARVMLGMAKDFDQNGKAKLAVEQLERLTKSYPTTAAGREGMHALDRHRHDKLLFGEDTPTQLAGPKSPAPGIGTAPGPKPSKDAVASKTGAATPATTAVAPAPPPPPPVTKPLPIGYRPNFQFPIHPSGWPTRITCDRDDAELVLVPAATFIMGRDDGDPEEGPPHEVFVSTYYIDLHEVTIGQYSRFLRESGRSGEVIKAVTGGKPVPNDLPMVNVTFKAAKAYCDWMKRRLPTEAQWELAARGPEGRISYWNEELPRKDPVKGDRPMEPVMSLSTDISPYGAYDLAANAWEWTSEYYDSKYYKQFRNLVRDPTGPKEPLARIVVTTVKGGSKKGILTWREGVKSELRFSYLGFRGALPVEGAPVTPVAAPAAPAFGPANTGGTQPF